MTTKIEVKINQIRNDLRKHNYNYYVLDDPAISDHEFDLLLKELEKLEKENPQYFDANSPTQRVGGGITKNFETKRHLHRMYSLDNSYSKEDLQDWEKRIEKILGVENIEFTCELKYDGASINLTYENGIPTRESCKNVPFYLFYNTPEVVNGFERLYFQIKSLPLNVFLLRVSNGASSPLFLDPHQTRLTDGESVNLSPIDFAELYTLLPKGEGRQSVLKDLQRASFNKLVEVEAGESVEKLMVFDRPDVMGKEISLVVDDVYVGGEPLPVTLHFEARSYDDGDGT